MSVSSSKQNKVDKILYTYNPGASQPHEHYFVISHPGMAEKWRKDKSIPLVDVLESFHVWRGYGEMVPKEELMRVFGSMDETEAFRKILSEGRVEEVTYL